MAYSGLFRPKNPQKYRGDHTNIVYRSLWELKFMRYLDDQENIIEWGSEEFSIPYVSPLDNRVHRYYPDFYVKKRDKLGVIESLVVEIKPAAQSKPPTPQTGKPTKRYLQEVYAWGVNSAKWKSAEKYCGARGWEFVVLTEKELDIKF
jgi:hypothetical protein